MSKRETTFGELPGGTVTEIETHETVPPPRSRMKSEFKERSRSASVWTMTQASRRSGAAMFKGRFCCCFALQAGVCMYSSMGLVQMICVFFTNIGGEIHELDRGHELIEFSILYIYVVAMFAGFGLTYFGSVVPSLKCLKIGNWCVLVFSIYWLIISCLSFVDRPTIVRSLCIDRRCPETHWLVKTYFRTYGDDCDLGEDALVDDGAFNEEREKGGARDDLGLDDDSEESSIPQGEALTEHLEHLGDINAENSTTRDETSNRSYSQPYPNPANFSPEGMSVRPGLEGLDLISFETRLIGCALNTKLYRILSIFAMLFWAIFVINGIIGAFMLMRKVRRASNQEQNQGLRHISFAQERQERMSRYNI